MHPTQQRLDPGEVSPATRVVGTDPIVLAAPPVVSDGTSGHAGLAMIVMPIVSGSGSLLITLTNRDRPLFAAAGLIFLVASVGLGVALVVGGRSSARRRQRESRERYLDYVETMRRRLRESAAAQRRTAARRHPDPEQLLDMAGLPPSLREREESDPDFLWLRLGVGVQPLERPPRLNTDDESPTTRYDPVCLTAARQLIDQYAELREQPVPLPMRPLGAVAITGEAAEARSLARAMVAQAALFHSPADLRIAVVRSPRATSTWAELRWLPHCLHESADAPLPGLLIMPVDELCAALDAAVETVRHLMLVVDEPDEAALTVVRRWAGDRRPSRGNVHLILLLDRHSTDPGHLDARITVGADQVVLATATDSELRLRRDRMTSSQLRSVARRLGMSPADHRARPGRTNRPQASLDDILGITDVRRLDVPGTWKAVTDADFLRVPIGTGAHGQPVFLDLKESALGGMGPHGLIVGATGSGKSELLRTLVTALVLRHPPDRLALLLVDFKGGATFAGLAELPHVAGMVTNLADDHGLVDRFRDALAGELQRRQQLLKDAGGLASLWEYRQRGHTVAPLPHLLVIIDEFSELLVARPDFADLFAAVGRIGRSIGVHLLLATQRLDTGRIRGLESHLSYRLALRTFSEAESREAVGTPDAYRLGPQPGSGYLKVGQSQFDWFSAPRVSGPYQPSRPRSEERPTPVLAYPAAGPVRRITPEDGLDHETPDGLGGTESVLDVAVSVVRAAGAAPARPVWLPPLPDLLDLDQVHERTSGDPHCATCVSAPLGLTDVPTEQRQDTLVWDFTGSAGNLVVVGAPLSGKSTLLQTLIGSLALCYRPGQLAFYCVDFGGGGLAALEQLPHVATVAGRADPDRVRRTIDDVHAMLDEREQLMRGTGLSTAAALRAARATGAVSTEVFGDVFLVVDGWGNLRDFEPEVEEAVGDIATRGATLGVHVILSVTTSSQLRARLAPAFGGRIELRLSDRFESQIDRVAVDHIPADVPGRALLPGARFAQIARPRLGAVDGGADDGGLVAEAVRRWPDERVPVVRVLPDRVDLPTVRRLAADFTPDAPGGIAIGLSERDLRPVPVELFGDDPHLVVYGDPQTGKSTLLRVLLTQLVDGRDPERVGIVLVDYRRTHLAAVPSEYLLAYCTSAQQTAQAAAEVASGLRARQPGPDVTPEQLRTRSWWQGREVVVVVDDYDLVATASGNPLAALAEYLPQGGDLGLHLVLARRTGGAARFQFEAILQALNDLSGPGLLFSGDRLEGRLVGGVASRRLPVGRARWVRRGHQPELVQGAWCPLS